MFGRYLGFLFTVMLFFSQRSFSFDPTTVAMGAQAVSGIVGGLEKADEAADLGFALGDLLSELGIESEGDGEVRNAVARLEDLNSRARDLRWSRDDVRNAIDYDLKRATTIAEKIKALRNMISASKRIAAVMGIRPKAGEKAATIQEIRINSMILEELQGLRRVQFLSYLEDREAKARRNIFMQEIVDQERGEVKVNRIDGLRVNRL
ncbi:MAG: hypothetical protein JSU04_20265 [Bdellovibrionales bacterium]|nr:hypothetical protein [Bdellovibrionales bacterium]